MTPEQEKSFRENGYIYIPGAVAKSRVLPVKDYVLKELKRLNIWSSGRFLSLALAGSHRLERQSQAKQQISELVSNGASHSVKVGGIELSILEMSGQAGDVYLMDMRLLYTPSINSTKNVRLMMTTRYLATQ